MRNAAAIWRQGVRENMWKLNRGVQQSKINGVVDCDHQELVHDLEGERFDS